MTAANHSDFQAYLKSICEDENYKKWGKLYTASDAEGKKLQDKQSLLPFDFSLNVQTVLTKEKKEKHKQEEIERLPVLQGIRKYAGNHVLLVGKPGSGKSTALARLLLEEAQVHLKIDSQRSSGNDTTIPILVELRYWQTSIFERIQAFLLQHDPNLNLDETTLKTLLRQNKFLLLIDGLNELPSEEARRQIAIFRKDYPKTPMIFTTRDLSVGGDLGIKKHLEMQPLNDIQMFDFIKAYIPQHEEKMLQHLGDRLRVFAQTPLMLCMLCELFDKIGNIPLNLGEVFRLFTKVYEHELRRDVAVIATPESRRYWKDLLKHLAFAMMQGKPATEFQLAIPRGEVEEIFTQYITAKKFDKPCDNPKLLLDDLLNHHLIQVSSDDKIEFRHHLLQEYYAAEHLLQLLPKLSDHELQRDYLNLLKWTEAVALMLALLEDGKQAVRVVQLALDVDLMLGVRLAGEVKPEFQQQPINLILGKKLPKLLETEVLYLTRSAYAVDALSTALNHPNSDVRNIAIEALGKIGSEKAVDTLITALNHLDSEIREKAVEALGEIGSEKAVDTLITALNHLDSRIRKKAVEALGKIGSEKALDPLINYFYNQKINIYYSSVLLALGEIGSEKAFDFIINASNNKDLYKITDNDIVKALAKTGSEKAVNFIISLIDQKNHYISLEIRESLQEIVDFGEKTALDAIVNALSNNGNSYVRAAAAQALDETYSKIAINALIKAFNDDESLYVRNHSLYSLISLNELNIINSEIILNSLSKALNCKYSLNENSYFFYKNILEQVQKNLWEKGVNVLVKALNSEEVYIIQEAANQLLRGVLCDKKTVNQTVILDIIKALNNEKTNTKARSEIFTLLKCVGNQTPYVLRYVGNQTAHVGNQTAVDTLIRLLNDEDSDFVNSAIEILGKIGSETAIDALINKLNDKNYENFYLRRDCVSALGKIGCERATDALIHALKYYLLDDNLLYDNYSYNLFCGEIVRALGKIGCERAIDALINILNNEDSRLHGCAARALGETGSEKAINALMNVLNYEDKYFNVCESATEALGKIGSEKAVDTLITALNHLDSNVRQEAAEALGEIGSEKAVESLINALYSDSNVFLVAGRALGEIGDEKAVDALINYFLNHYDSYLINYSGAVELLGKTGSKKAVDALITALNHPSHGVQTTAVEGLGQIDSEKAVDALITALNHPNSRVREKAVELLGEIGSEKAANAIITALNHPDVSVRVDAIAELKVNESSDKIIRQMWELFLNGKIWDQMYEHPSVLVRNYAEMGYKHRRVIRSIESTKSIKNLHPKILDTISYIQGRYKFYNHDIFHSLPVTNEDLKSMSENSKYQHQFNFHGQVGNFNAGDTTIENLNGIQNNYPEQKIKQTLVELKPILEKIQRQHPNVNEQEATQIVEAEFLEIKQNEPGILQNLVSLKRWLNGTKALVSEAVKHCVNDSVYAKAFVAFLEGFSEDV